MFERYTEKARRTIFFSRYEASQYGSPKIEPEHLLLGLLREDKALYRWLPNTAPEVIRRKIDEHLEKKKCISTAVDLPLGDMAKKVLKHAANEADRLASRHIGPEHLFLGFLHEECFASKLLREGGADATQMRTHYAQQSEPPRPWSFQRGSYPDLGFRTLSQETVEIHGSPWNVDYVRDVVRMCRAYNWHWRHATWKPRAVEMLGASRLTWIWQRPMLRILPWSKMDGRKTIALFAAGSFLRRRMTPSTVPATPTATTGSALNAIQNSGNIRTFFRRLSPTSLEPSRSRRSIHRLSRSGAILSKGSIKTPTSWTALLHMCARSLIHPPRLRPSIPLAWVVIRRDVISVFVEVNVAVVFAHVDFKFLRRLPALPPIVGITQPVKPL
jgi:hypothetical protein